MKFFVTEPERKASGHENYVEFRVPEASQEFWDSDSINMSEETMQESGFGEFWYECMCRDIVFDMDTIFREDLVRMAAEAASCGGTVLEVFSELRSWAEPLLTRDGQYISVNRAYDRMDRGRGRGADQ